MKKISLEKLLKKILEFRDKRNWKKYHSPKNMIIAFYCELAELAEHFQYETDKSIKEKSKIYDEKISDELIDVLWWTLLIAHEYGIHIDNPTIRNKINKFYPRKSLLIMFNSIGKISSEIVGSKDKIQKKYLLKNKKAFSKEIQSIFNQVVLFSIFFNLDVEKEFLRKFDKNNKKYPINSKRISLLKLISDKLHKTI